MTVLDRSASPADPIAGEATRRRSTRRSLRLDLVSLVGTAIAVVAAGIGAQRLSDNSFLTHLASGREMLEHGFVHTDRFTWTSAGEPIVMQSWLASLLYGTVDAIAGLWGVRILMSATAALLGALAWRLTERSPSLGTRVVIMVPVLLIGLRTWSERPLLVGLVLFAIVALVVEGKGRPSFLFLVGAVWVNVHGSWPLGLVLVASLWFGCRLDARAARRDRGPGCDGAGGERERAAGGWLALGCVTGGVLNPYGPALLLFPLRLLDRGDTLSLIAEWKSPAFDVGWTRAFLVLVLMTVVAVSRRSVWRLTVPTMVFVAAALMSRRNIPVATLALLPAVAQGLPAIGRLDGRRTSNAIHKGTVVLAALLVALPLVAVRAPHFDGSRYPEEPIDAMEAAGSAPDSARYVHQDFVGNYLGLRYRGPVAWIDDRFELHPTELVEDYVVLLDGGAGWSEVLERYDAEVVLWPTDAALTQLVRDVAGWSLAYADDDWTVLCRPDLTACPSVGE